MAIKRTQAGYSLRRQARGKGTKLGAVRPAASLRAHYQAALTDAVDKMARNVADAATTWYAASGLTLAMDSPIDDAVRMFKRLSEQWQRRFDKLAPGLAEYFATTANERVKGQLQTMLRDAGFSVRFRLTKAQSEVLKACVAENVTLIKSLASQYLTAAEGAVMRSASVGRDMAALTDDLERIANVTRNRAALIARDQTNKATADITRVRQIELGLKAQWLHSAGGQTPRPEHVAFSGKTYDPAKGAFLEGKWTWPGKEINCRCVSVSVVPGFDD